MPSTKDKGKSSNIIKKEKTSKQNKKKLWFNNKIIKTDEANKGHEIKKFFEEVKYFNQQQSTWPTNCKDSESNVIIEQTLKRWKEYFYNTGCGRQTWRFLSPVILATVWGGVRQPRSVTSWFHAISVAMEQYTAQHCAFIVEAYFKNGNSAVTTRLFRRHFNILRHGRVPSHNTIKEWVQNF